MDHRINKKQLILFLNAVHSLSLLYWQFTEITVIQNHLSIPFIDSFRCFIDSFSHNKKINWKPYSGRSQAEMKCYKRLIYKQCSSQVFLAQFLSYLPKRFTHLCRALYGRTPYWCTVLVDQYGCRKSTKTSGVHFSYKSSFFSLENSHMCA